MVSVSTWTKRPELCGVSKMGVGGLTQRHVAAILYMVSIGCLLVTELLGRTEWLSHRWLCHPNFDKQAHLRDEIEVGTRKKRSGTGLVIVRDLRMGCMGIHTRMAAICHDSSNHRW